MEEDRKRNILSQVPPDCRALFSRFVNSEYPPTMMKSLCPIFAVCPTCFHLRTKIKQVDSDTDGTRKLCNNGLEDVKHFLFVCQALNTVRTNEYDT